jgi:integrase
VSGSLEKFRSWADDITLNQINSEMVERYQRCQLRKCARSTVDKDINYLLRLIRQNGFQVGRPSSKRGKTTEVRALTQDELKRFFTACSPEHKPMFLLMLVTGARPAEVLPSSRSGHVALLKRDLDIDNCRVTIRTAKQTSGSPIKSRIHTIPQELMDLIVKSMATVKGPHVFPGQMLLHRVFTRIIEEAGIEKVDPLGHKLVAHSFRHTYATMVAGTVGGNPFILKQALGHSKISTTDRYCHPKAPAEIIDITPYIEEFSSSGGDARVGDMLD